MRPSYYIDPEYKIPSVPFFVNCYYGPQPTAKRCYQLGRAVRAAIERIPLDLNVAVIGSGGLWHLPNYPNSWLDETFDANILAGIKPAMRARRRSISTASCRRSIRRIKPASTSPAAGPAWCSVTAAARVKRATGSLLAPSPTANRHGRRLHSRVCIAHRRGLRVLG